MRIIAGSRKGSQIVAPKGHDTRPTQDRVRESLFNILQGDVPGASVLDLFAGSGALGLESISRGAQAAVFVDSARIAIDCLRKNVEKLGFNAQAQILPGEWHLAIRRLARQKSQFDLVFLDPPYAMEDTTGMMAALADAGLLSGGALMVVEHRKGADPAPHPLFTLRDKRCYGDTEISFLDYAGKAEIS